MIGVRPKQYARMGMFYMEEAVLDVLLEAKHEGNRIGAKEISLRAGIFRDRGKANIMNDAIVHGVLVSLHAEGRVERCMQTGKKVRGWQLTDEEFNLRRDDA